MTDPRRADVEAVVRDWLDETRPRLSDAALERALAEAGRRRRRAPRRASRPWLLLVAATLIVGGLASAAVVGTRSTERTAIAPPSLDSSSPEPVAIAGASAISGTWYAAAEGAPPWVLRLARLATLQGPDGIYVSLDGWGTTRTELRLPGPVDGSCLGVPGAYRFELDGDQLELAAIGDPCAQRAALARRWQRLRDDQGIADRFRVPYVYPRIAGRTLWESTDTMSYIGGQVGNDTTSGMGIWVAREGYADRCAGSGPLPLAPGVGGWLAYLRTIPEIEVGPTADRQVDGRPGIDVRIIARADACPAGKLRIWPDNGRSLDGRPVEDWFGLPAGGNALLTAIQVGESTIVVATWTDGGEPPRTDHDAFLSAIHFLVE